MNDRGRVEVPENGMRSEPIAFGLSAVQLLLSGAAVLLAAAVNASPLWLPAKLALVCVLAGPVVLAAVLPVGGEPAYRWVVRAVRYARGSKVWHAELRDGTLETDAGQAADMPPASPDEAADKPEISGAGDDVAPAVAGGAAPDTPVDHLDTPPESQDPRSPSAPGARESRSMGDRIVPLRVVPTGDPGSEPQAPDPPDGAQDRPSVVPHLLPGLRIVTLLSFAGGVGKTTLAVEAATLVAAQARYRTMDGDEHPLRVLLLDASRVTSGAAGMRLGLSGEALSRAANPARWHHPQAVEDLAVATRWGVDLVMAPPDPVASGWEPQPEAERDAFRADRVDDLLEGAREAGYQLVVADLGSHLEDGHRHLLDRADLVLGVVRPTLESLPDVHRLAALLRGLGSGRKLALVASQANDDAAVRAHAREAGVTLAAAVPPDPAFTDACERGEPAWLVKPALEPALREVAAAAWPLLGDAAGAQRGGLRGPARRLASLRRGADR